MRFLTPLEFASWWQEFWGDADPHLRAEAHPSAAHLTTPTSGYGHTVVQHPDGRRIRVGGWLLAGQEFGIPPEHIGIIATRQGAYSLGMVHHGTLVKHHTDRRYVQGRTAAGGWSQQRYARRRKNQRTAQGEVLVAKIPQVISKPQALIWAGDRHMYSEVAAELYANQEYAAWQHLPQREFPDLGKPSFAILKQAAWRSSRIMVQELGSSS